MKKKLKILHTMTWLAPGGGVDKNVFLTIQDLEKEFDFHLAVGRDIFNNDFVEIENLTIHKIEELGRTLKPFQDLKALFSFYKLIKKEKYDIIHTHETKASLLSRIAGWMARCPYIIYGLHGVTFNDPLSKIRRLIYISIERMTIWMNHHVVSVGQNTLSIYHEHNLGKNIPSQVAYSGIDTEKFISSLSLVDEQNALCKELNIQPDKFVIINIGRFSYSKAQRYTISAFKEIKSRYDNAVLLLVGDGELIDECREQVKKLGLECDVIFYGFSNKIGNLLAISDLMLLTSLREGLPRVVVEAGLCKVPTVAFEVEGIREVIIRKYQEFVVPAHDVDKLVQKSLKLIEDDQLREEYGEAEFNHAKDNWDYKKMTSELRDLYNTRKHR